MRNVAVAHNKPHIVKQGDSYTCYILDPNHNTLSVKGRTLIEAYTRLRYSAIKWGNDNKPSQH